MRSPSAPNPSPIEQRQSAETTTSATGSFRVAHGRPQSWGSEYLQEPALGALELLSWRLDRSGRSFARAPRTRGAAGAAGRACAGVLQVALVERRGCSHGGALVCCARSMMLYEKLFRALATQPPAGSQHAPPLAFSRSSPPGSPAARSGRPLKTTARRCVSHTAHAAGGMRRRRRTGRLLLGHLGRALQPSAVVQTEEEGEEVGADESHRAHQAQDELDGELQGRERDGDAAQAAQAVGVLGAEGAERKGADGLRTHSGFCESEMRGRSGPLGLEGRRTAQQMQMRTCT